MKRLSENRTLALCALMTVAGLLLSVGFGSPTEPGGRLRTALLGGAHADTVAVRP